ncbi:MAG: PucR family transcriptional regulator ligand-binding domain-containing protein [Megasphaera sp.]|uniref:PucR family transcriptional regulator n=1 Tax=Megasphaera sp. TaxID=2023260 RepID=UPI0025C2B104|nr:PucR family transcriptional regulator ligand-binding domain-containing protein [Megasphaera sp.]MCF0152027.1 PucR family transcriptional regulator ligand-binding domain-containing protein [Megasphaera sp.]MCI7600710.1 PucR family transcriptional regulator ligand-binding domain-containing protein [Megasphaera sp.]
MSLSIHQLYKQDENKYKLNLLAGRQGLSHDVAWVQVMEDADYGSFLRPHALIFTTGLASHGDPHWLEGFVESLLDADASGLVVNTGKYLFASDITAALKARCEEAAFPLFTMPWEVRLADITQSFLSSLFLMNREEYRAITAWKEFLFGVRGSSVLSELALTGWKEEGPYTALVLSGPDADASLLADSKSFLNHLGLPYFIFPYKDTLVLLLKGGLPADLVSWLKAHDRLVTGQGLTAPVLKQLPDSCRQGQQALVWARLHHRSWCYFGALGAYALFFSQPDDHVLRVLHDRALGDLLAYDEAHQSSLYATLEAYLCHDGSLKGTAAQLYTHRNTVAYRIHKAEKLIPYDLNDWEQRFTVFLACHIHRYFEILEISS